MTAALDAIRERDAAYTSLGYDLTNPRTGREQMAADRRVLLAALDRAETVVAAAAVVEQALVDYETRLGAAQGDAYRRLSEGRDALRAALAAYDGAGE